MSSTASGAETLGSSRDTEAHFEASSAHQYFRAIEDCFLDWRGAPLTLNPKDWQLARLWFEQGVPLRLVIENLESLFERRDQEGQDKISSLRYFRSAIEAAWRRRQEFLAPASEVDTPDVDVPMRLAALGRALPSGLPDRNAWCRRLEALSGTPEGVEAQLSDLDVELRRHVVSRLPTVEQEALQSRLETALKRLAGRLPDDELQRSAERLEVQFLRRHAGLPALSLFSPEALSE